MSYINMVHNASYNFVPPTIAEDADRKIEVVFPTSEHVNIDPSEVDAIVVKRTATVINLGLLLDDVALSVTPEEDVPDGAILLIQFECGETSHNVSFSTGFVSQPLKGEPGAKKSKLFIFDGTSFIESASANEVEGEVEGDVQAIIAAAVMPATITKQNTVIAIAAMGAAGTLNLTVADTVKKGAILQVVAESDATARDLTPGTGMVGPVIAGVISKKIAASYMYDGSNFVMMGASIQLN